LINLTARHDDVEALFVPLPSGKQVPIGQLADIRYAEGPAQIHGIMQNVEYIGFNVHDRDVESVIEEPEYP
jgi:cobalt-zinc-cadmium resistance protein CzcA